MGRSRRRVLGASSTFRMLPVLVVIVVLLALAAADAPKVVSTEPVSGAEAIVAGPSEIRVVFDRAMKTDAFGFGEGDDRFPRRAGTPRWVDERTVALPVILAPGRDYVLPINSDGAGGAGSDDGFRATDDTPAEPYELRFRTSVEVQEAIAADGLESASETAP